MANYFTRFLTGVGEGLLTPKGQSANWRHATKLFIDGNMRLAPRTKFNYYVIVFTFNVNAIFSKTYE